MTTFWYVTIHIFAHSYICLLYCVTPWTLVWNGGSLCSECRWLYLLSSCVLHGGTLNSYSGSWIGIQCILMKEKVNYFPKPGCLSQGRKHVLLKNTLAKKGRRRRKGEEKGKNKRRKEGAKEGGKNGRRKCPSPLGHIYFNHWKS